MEAVSGASLKLHLLANHAWGIYDRPVEKAIPFREQGQSQERSLLLTATEPRWREIFETASFV